MKFYYNSKMMNPTLMAKLITSSPQKPTLLQYILYLKIEIIMFLLFLCLIIIDPSILIYAIPSFIFTFVFVLVISKS